jgi:hypothetical protein
MQKQTQILTNAEYSFETATDCAIVVHDNLKQLTVDEVDCVSGAGWNSWVS